MELASFPPSSFWLLAVYKNGEGRRGPLHHVNDVSVYLGRPGREGVLNQKNTFRTRVLCLDQYVLFFGFANTRILGLVQKLQGKASSSFFQLRTPPSSVYLGRHWCHSYNKMDLLPPILDTVSDQKLRVGRPGSEAKALLHFLHCFSCGIILPHNCLELVKLLILSLQLLMEIDVFSAGVFR